MALAQVDFYSTSLMRMTNIWVIMPSDKRVRPSKLTTPQPQGPYKTLYLLHGLMGNSSDWTTHTRIQKLANDFNLAVIMPSGDNKFWCDSAVSGDRYGTFVGTELVDFTRRTFNLSTRREDTFIGGLSMGGFGATVNGLRNPKTFSRVIALSSAFIKDQILSSTDPATDDFFGSVQYETMFGIPDVAAFSGSDNDYEALAEKVAASGEDKPSFFMACGAEDGLFGRSVAFKNMLVGLGFDVTWHEGPGAHHWDVWDRDIELALTWLPLGDAVEGVSSGNVQNGA